MIFGKYKVNMNLKKRCQKGLTLVELLIASVISIVVINMSVVTFIQVKNSHKNVENMNARNSKALMVEEIIERALLNNSFACSSASGDLTFADNTGDSIAIFDDGIISAGVMPFDDAIYGFLPATMETGCTTDCAELGSNYLAIQRDDNLSIIDSVQNSITRVPSNFGGGVGVNDYVVTCSATDISLMRVIARTDTELTTVVVPDPVSAEGQYIGDYVLNIFYTRDSSATYANGDAIMSLYLYQMRSSGGGLSYELVRGVSNFTVETIRSDDIVIGSVLDWQSVAATINVDSDFEAIRISFDVADDDGNTENFRRTMAVNIY